MADERIWPDVEYRLADEPEFIRPTGNSNFRQVEKWDSNSKSVSE